MTRPRLAAVVVLVVCAVSDLASVPPLLSASGDNAPPDAIAVVVGVLGLATLGAAAGVRAGSRRSWWAALVVRLVDGVGAAPGLGASDHIVVAAAATTLALSVVAVALLVGVRPERVTGIEPA